MMTVDTIKAFVEDMTPLRKITAKAKLEKLVRSQGRITTWAELIKAHVADGATVRVSVEPDNEKRETLANEISRLLRTAPTGNEKHPATIRLRQIQQELADGPTISTRQLFYKGAIQDERDVGKTVIDYAEFLIGQSLSSSASNE